jgi:hypothetical protein
MTLCFFPKTNLPFGFDQTTGVPLLLGLEI